MLTASQISEPIEVFYSYSHKDERLRNQLETALAALKRQGIIAGWCDRKISAGTEWKDRIDSHLNSTRLILLLVSSDFLASDYCSDIEVKRAMERHKSGAARVIPVILRACDWHDTPFGKLQALPKDGKAVTSWGNRDEAFTNIAQGIRQAVEELAENKPRELLASQQMIDFIGLSIFAPVADIKGKVQGFIDRREELKKLSEMVKVGKSLVVVEGIWGAGKTALTAALCRRFSSRKVAWVPCGDLAELKNPLTLVSLLRSFASDQDMPKSTELRRLLGQTQIQSAEIINVLIQYLTDNRIMLVLDDFGVVEDEAVHQFVERIQRSAIKSTLILNSRQHPGQVEKLPLVGILPTLNGLSRLDARQFLRNNDLRAEDHVLDKIWERTGHGIPEAMRIFVGLTKNHDVHDMLEGLPVYTEKLEAWIDRLIRDLTPTEQKLAKLIAFCREPAPRELLETSFDRSALHEAIHGLLIKSVISESDSHYSMHTLCEDYVLKLLTDTERREYNSLVAKYYQEKARDILQGVGEEPSYGKLYLEAHPDYVKDEKHHEEFIDDLLERLEDNQLLPPSGSTVLVLGAGHGTHDAGLAKHGFKIINVDFLQEVVEIGRERAQSLHADITYTLADMTQPLNLEQNSIDAVYNIGSSFGYEAEDKDNAAIFQNAAAVLAVGKPFIFEYVNGIFWTQDIERKIDVLALPDGSIRTKHHIYDPVAKTSLDTVSLERPNGSTGWFHHFMHYYDIAVIRNMLADVGLKPVAVYGSAKGEEFDPHKSRSMVILAIKETTESLNQEDQSLRQEIQGE